MPKAGPVKSNEVCARCLQPVPAKAARCANCGNKVNSFRGLPLLVGFVGMAALIFVIVIMFQVVQNVDIESAPPEQQQDESSVPQDKPAMSSEQGKADNPSKPDKPPPLNQ
jgi:cytoskeletal protein RodZ